MTVNFRDSWKASSDWQLIQSNCNMKTLQLSGKKKNKKKHLGIEGTLENIQASPRKGLFLGL